MLLGLSWRNLWRNRRRTAITLTALSLGVTAVVFIHSYRESAFSQMVQEITTGLVGHLQIHGKGYQTEPEISNVVQDPATVEARLVQALPGAQPLRRVLGYGLAGAQDTSAAALIIGLQPERERADKSMRAIESGRDLADKPGKEAVLGNELAVQLGVVPGGELVLVGQAADGSVANDRFTVVGLADAGSAELNGSAVFLHLADAQDFFGLGQGVHQIVVRLPTDEEDLTRPLASLKGALDLATLEALSWSEMLPELKGMMEQKRSQQHIIDVVVILIVGLGVLNAMTMSTFERTREIGVMASLGTRRRRILAILVGEALLQGLLGLAIGLSLAAALLYGLGNVSMTSVSGSDVMGIRFPAAIHLKIAWVAMGSATVTALFTVLAGAFWPAWRASRLKPVEATRYV
jgi:ABC-type lipoprotein release transport system permease subunit